MTGSSRKIDDGEAEVTDAGSEGRGTLRVSYTSNCCGVNGVGAGVDVPSSKVRDDPVRGTSGRWVHPHVGRSGLNAEEAPLRSTCACITSLCILRDAAGPYN